MFKALMNYGKPNNKVKRKYKIGHVLNLVIGSVTNYEN